MSTSIADLLVDTLANAGVKHIWGVTGDSLNGINDSLQRLDKISFMHVRNEESGAFAAGAEAAATGKLAVCAGSCGPGNLHLINGLYDCHRNRVPVLAIASHIPSSEIGLGYFQETHPTEIFRECSHFCEMVSNPAQLPQILHRALRTAVGKRGVAVLVLPGDVSLLEVDESASARITPVQPPRVVPADQEVERATTLLNAGKAVTILAGAGCIGAHDEVVALARALSAPIVHAFRGKEHLEWDNPFDVGMTGLIGFSSGYHALLDCDTLLMLGTALPYRNFYPSDATIIQVDNDPSALGQWVNLELGILADVVEFARAITPRIETPRPTTFLDQAVEHYAKARQSLDDLATPRTAGKPLHPQYVSRCVNKLASDDAIFTVDVGTPAVWAARYLRMNGQRRLIGSFNHGSMACALPQALGAQGAFPGRQVISMSGDGGLTMLMGDLLSAVQLELPIKIVLLNNGTLGFVEMEMLAAGSLPSNVALENTNFADIANAVGIRGWRVENSDDLEGVLQEAFAHPGPALVDVVSARLELSMPPALKLEQAKGFSLYTLRAIMSGRGDEIVELAKTNLFR